MSGPDGGGRSSASGVEDLCRLVLGFRSLILIVTIAYVATWDGDPTLLSIGFVLAALGSYLPVRYWDRLGPALIRHPGLLGVDLVLALMILLLTGPESPFFYYTLGTALLAGLLHGLFGAGFFSVLLILGYLEIVQVRESLGESLEGFQVHVGNPSLYALAALAGVAVKGLLDRQAETEAALARVERSGAVSEERARLAREMHDSLVKTVQGIALSASALSHRLGGNGAPGRDAADSLAGTAKRAAREARDLLDGLRTERLEAPLAPAVRDHVEGWSRRTGVPCAVTLAEIEVPAPIRYQLLTVVKESLLNVERHSRGRSAQVSLERTDAGATLSISDDGVGIRGPVDPGALAGSGHYGIVGMSERARRAGGELEVRTEPGEGTTIVVTFPLRGATEPEGVAA